MPYSSTPPICSRCSNTVTSHPRCASLMAAVMPAGPLPTIATDLPQGSARSKRARSRYAELMKLSILEKWIGVPLCPCTQEPSHWFEWLQTIEHTALIGLFSKRSAPASSIFFCLKSSMTCGIDVCTGQPFS